MAAGQLIDGRWGKFNASEVPIILAQILLSLFKGTIWYGARLERVVSTDLSIHYETKGLRSNEIFAESKNFRIAPLPRRTYFFVEQVATASLSMYNSLASIYPDILHKNINIDSCRAVRNAASS